MVPVDYVARVLCALTFATNPKHRVYHVSAGLASSVSGTELCAAFDAHHGHRHDDPIETADISRLWRERDRLARYLGPGDEERLLRYLGRCVETSRNRSVYEQMRADG